MGDEEREWAIAYVIGTMALSGVVVSRAMAEEAWDAVKDRPLPSLVRLTTPEPTPEELARARALAARLGR